MFYLTMHSTHGVRHMVEDNPDSERGNPLPPHGMVHIKDPLLLIGKSSPCGGRGFPLFLPYIRRHITVNKMC